MGVIDKIPDDIQTKLFSDSGVYEGKKVISWEKYKLLDRRTQKKYRVAWKEIKNLPENEIKIIPVNDILITKEELDLIPQAPTFTEAQREQIERTNRACWSKLMARARVQEINFEPT